MNAHTQRLRIAGPAGELDTAIDAPADGSAPPRGLALVCHPHPLHGGTMDNKVVQTVARAARLTGWRVARFNFRGVGTSAGQWDEGRGEIDDAAAVLSALRAPGEAVLLAGFSFGAYVASQLAARWAPQPVGEDAAGAALPLVLVAPAASRFEVAAVPAHSLVIHGEADDVVPLQAVLDWARPLAQPVTVVPAAGHFFHGQLPLLRQLIVTYLAGRSAAP